MLPTIKEPYSATASTPETASAANSDDAGGQSQPPRHVDAVGAEIPVVVHASRYSSASLGVGKNLPPVHEETRTVIVFPNGAVVRISASMAAGELVVLTNKQTGADVICKVVSVKAQPGIQNYVNLEFTQRAPGFWDANGSSENNVRSESPAMPAMAPLPVPATLTETRSPLTIQTAAPKSVPPSLPITARTDFVSSFTSTAARLDTVAPVETHLSSSALSGGLLGTDSSSGERRHGSSTDAAQIPNWVRPNDPDSRAGRDESSGSKKILLMVGAGILLLGLGGAGGFWLLRSTRPSASEAQTQAASNALAQAVPLPAVTTDQDAALPQQIAPESGSLQSAVATSSNGQSNTPSIQATSASSPSESPSERGAAQPRVVDTPPARHPNMVVGALSAPVAKSPVVRDTVDAPPVLAGQANNISESNTLGNGVSGEARIIVPAAPAHTGGQIQPAKLLTSVAPTYPFNATGKHIEGVVTIDAQLDEAGRVVFMKVLSGPPELQQAAMLALRKWKYQPATLNGQAIESHTIVNLSFHLH